MSFLALLPILKRLWFVPVVGAILIYAMIERGNARHWHKKADACAQARQADQASWDAAAVQYRAAVTAREAQQTQAKETADAKLNDALDRARAAATRFVRVRREEDRRGTGYAAGQSPAAQVADGAGQMPVVDGVRVSADDVEACSVNTARLLNAKTWSEGLK